MNRFEDDDEVGADDGGGGVVPLRSLYTIRCDVVRCPCRFVLYSLLLLEEQHLQTQGYIVLFSYTSDCPTPFMNCHQHRHSKASLGNGCWLAPWVGLAWFGLVGVSVATGGKIYQNQGKKIRD